MLYTQFGWNWPRVSVEDFLNFVNVISLLHNYLPLEKGVALHLNKIESLSPKMLCAKICWYWLSGSGEEDFLISSTHFRYFVIISLWKKVGPFIWRNLNPLYFVLCGKFGWNWLGGTGEDENVESLQRRTTDNRRSEKLTWAFSSGELKNYGPDTNLHWQKDRRTERRTDRHTGRVIPLYPLK